MVSSDFFEILVKFDLYYVRHLRWGLHLLLDYFLPAYTILQGLGNLLPFVGYHAASLLAMLRGDAGVRIFLSILKFQRQVCWTKYILNDLQICKIFWDHHVCFFIY